MTAKHELVYTLFWCHASHVTVINYPMDPAGCPCRISHECWACLRPLLQGFYKQPQHHLLDSMRLVLFYSFLAITSSPMHFGLRLLQFEAFISGWPKKYSEMQIVSCVFGAAPRVSVLPGLQGPSHMVP